MVLYRGRLRVCNDAFGILRYSCEDWSVSICSLSGKCDMCSASSALRCCTTSWNDVRAPSHFSLCESFPPEKTYIRYPREYDGFFSRITAASGSSIPVRYQKSED